MESQTKNTEICAISGEKLPVSHMHMTEIGFVASYLWGEVPAEVGSGSITQLPPHLIRLHEALKNRTSVSTYADDEKVRCVISGEMLDEDETLPTPMGPVAQYLWADTTRRRTDSDERIFELPEHLSQLLKR